MAAQQRIKEFVHEHDLWNRPHALIWLSKVYGTPAGMCEEHCHELASIERVKSPYSFIGPHTSFLVIFRRSRLSSSRPGAILITPYQAKPTSSPPSFSSLHDALRSRHPTQRISGAKRVRQPHQLNVNQRHVHLFEFKYCEDMRPGH
eukprot:495628-Pelagomonas_calceolata.AAC.1